MGWSFSNNRWNVYSALFCYGGVRNRHEPIFTVQLIPSNAKLYVHLFHCFVVCLSPIDRIIDLWNSSASRAARAQSAAADAVPLAHATVTLSRVSFIAVLLFLVDDHAIVSCRSARTRHVALPAPTRVRWHVASRSGRRTSDSLPCVDVLGSAPARRSHGSPSEFWLPYEKNKQEHSVEENRRLPVALND